MIKLVVFQHSSCEYAHPFAAHIMLRLKFIQPNKLHQKTCNSNSSPSSSLPLSLLPRVAIIAALSWARAKPPACTIKCASRLVYAILTNACWHAPRRLSNNKSFNVIDTLLYVYSTSKVFCCCCEVSWGVLSSSN